MKKITVYLMAAVLLGAACTNLDVEVKSELVPENFPLTQEQFVAASGVIYTEFALGFADNYWLMTELSGDGFVLTANGGNWFDGGRYRELHYHDWSKNNELLSATWSWLYKTINTCNKVYSLLADAEESEAKAASVAELRTMRAFCYYLLIDNFGDVPLIREFGEDLRPRDGVAEVFGYIETELLESLPDLRKENDRSTWGRPTQLTACAILAKLYLNAGKFTGQNRYDDAVSACDRVIAFEKEGQTELSPRDRFLKMFDCDNGPDFKEFLLAIPYDENNLKSFKPSRYNFSIYHPTAWNYKFTVSSCMRTLPSHYDLFTEDPNDIREQVFLKEEQYYPDGLTPMILPVTKVQLDSRYTGDDKDAIVNYHIRLTREIEFRNVANFDTGDDVSGRLAGYRSNKYPPSHTQSGREQSNDFPVLRYADVLLMKAEAILRGAAPTGGETAASLVNRVRERAGCAPLGSVNLEQLLDERAREFSLEAWRRNDLIRFGKYEDRWLLKTDSDIRRRLYPIPEAEIRNNPLLEQNPGY
jgi:hypothetical protein